MCMCSNTGPSPKIVYSPFISLLSSVSSQSMTPLSQWTSQGFFPLKPCHGVSLRKPSTAVSSWKPVPESRIVSEPSGTIVAYIAVTALQHALLPAAQGTMVQHQTDSFTDNVTSSVQSRFYKPGISRRALLPAHCGLQRKSHCMIMCAPCCQRRWA